jgi:hypothetical protein
MLLGLVCALTPHSAGLEQEPQPTQKVVRDQKSGASDRPTAKGRATRNTNKRPVPRNVHRLVPPRGKCLVIIGQNEDGIDEYAREIGRDFAGVMTYISAREPERLGEFERMLEKYPNAVFQVGLGMVGDLDAIDGGELDAKIKEMGKVFKRSRRPVYLRVGYEFDLEGNHYEPVPYIHAFRRVRDLLTRAGVDNVSYVWHSVAFGVDETTMNWYPGDDYVDWFGATCFGGTLSDMVKIANLAALHGKPLMLAEATPRGIGVTAGVKSWRKWFVPTFDFIARYDVRAFCYISWDWESIPMFRGQGWGDTRISRNEVVKSAWIREMKKPRYVLGGPSLDKLLGYQP